MANDIKKIASDFHRNLGNGVNAATNLYEMFVDAVNTGDTGYLTRAMSRAIQEKNDEQAANTISFILRHVWKGAKPKKDKEGNVTVKVKGIKPNRAVLERFNDAVSRKLSLRHNTFRKTIAGDTSKPVFDPAASAERFVKSHKEADVKVYIAALQAQLKAKGK